MTTYWLIGEKSDNMKSKPDELINCPQSNASNNPSITFQGPDSPAAHSLTHSQSPERNGSHENKKNTADELINERDRIKHEIATFVAKDLINNIDNAVKEFRKSKSANFNPTPPAANKSLCNGNERGGLITPTYDKELVISKGKVRDVVNRLNNSAPNDASGKCKMKPL